MKGPVASRDTWQPQGQAEGCEEAMTDQAGTARDANSVRRLQRWKRTALSIAFGLPVIGIFGQPLALQFRSVPAEVRSGVLRELPMENWQPRRRSSFGGG